MGGRAACGLCGARLSAAVAYCPRCGSATAPPEGWPASPVPHLLVEPRLTPPAVGPPPHRALSSQAVVALAAAGTLLVVSLAAWALVDGDRRRLPGAATGSSTTLAATTTVTVPATTTPTTARPAPTTTLPTTTTLAPVPVLERAWRYDAAGDLATGLGWDGALVYGVTTSGRLFALDPATGAEAWSTRVDGALSFRFGPVVRGGVVLVAGSGATSMGELLAFDAATGAPRWRFGLEQDVLDQPMIVVGDRVIAVGRQVVALDLHGGGELWRAELSELSLVSPTPLSDGARAFAFVFDTQLRLLGLDPASGAELGRPVVPTAQLPTCALAATPPGSAVVCAIDRQGTIANDVVAFDPATGEQRWRSPLPGRLLARPQTIAGAAVMAAEHHVLAVDLATGERRWDVPVQSTFASIATGDRWVLLGAARLEVLDPATGALVATAPVDSLFVDPPTAAGSLALVQDLEGVVHAYALP